MNGQGGWVFISQKYIGTLIHLAVALTWYHVAVFDVLMDSVTAMCLPYWCCSQVTSTVIRTGIS